MSFQTPARPVVTSAAVGFVLAVIGGVGAVKGMFLLSLAAVIVAHRAQRATRPGDGRDRRLAIGGLVIGYLGLAIGVWIALWTVG